MVSVRGARHRPPVWSIWTWRNVYVLDFPVFLFPVHDHPHAKAAPYVDILYREMTVGHHVDAVLPIVVVLKPIEFPDLEILCVGNVLRGGQKKITCGIVWFAFRLHAWPQTQAVRREPFTLRAPVPLRKAEVPARAAGKGCPVGIHHLHLLHRNRIWIPGMPFEIRKHEIGI